MTLESNGGSVTSSGIYNSGSGGLHQHKLHANNYMSNPQFKIAHASFKASMEGSKIDKQDLSRMWVCAYALCHLYAEAVLNAI